MFEKTVVEPNDERIATEIIPEQPTDIEPVVLAQNKNIETELPQEPAVATVTEKDVPKQPQPAPLTHKEMKALKRVNYETKIMNNPEYKMVYLLGNTKTGQMVAIRAASSFHACKIIGWKSGRVKLLGSKVVEEIEKEKKEAAKNESTDGSTNPVS